MFGWIFTNILAASGVLYGWLNPLAGLMVYWAFAILRPIDLWFWAFNRYDPPRYAFYIAIATLLGWGLAGFGDFAGLRRVFWPVAGLWIYLLSGLFGMEFLAISREFAWDQIYPQLTIGVMAVVTVSTVRTERALHIFAYGIGAAMGYLGWVFNSQYKFDGFNRIQQWGFGNADNNGAAMMMVLGVPVCFFLGIYDRRWWVKALAFFSALSLSHVVLLTYSRGGMLGLIVVGIGVFLIALFTLPNKAATLSLALVAVALVFALAGPAVRARFGTIMPFADKAEMEASAASRYDTWGGALKCIAEHPFGVGPRNFNLVSHLYGLPANKSVHNLFLQTGADYGIIGMLGLALFYFGTMATTVRITLSSVARRLVWPRIFGAMTATGLAGFLVCSQFIGMEAVEHGYILALLGLCTVAYVDRVEKAQAAADAGGIPELAEVPRELAEGETPPFPDEAEREPTPV